MDSDAAMSARQQLDLLRTKLVSRGWPTDHRGTEQRPFLHVRNPDDAGFNASVATMAGSYCWAWGPEISPVSDVAATADQIMHVLRMAGR